MSPLRSHLLKTPKVLGMYCMAPLTGRDVGSEFKEMYSGDEGRRALAPMLPRFLIGTEIEAWVEDGHEMAPDGV